MKRRSGMSNGWTLFIITMSLLVWIFSFSTIYAQSDPIPLMPLGDSVTRGSGSSDWSGYRGELQSLLDTAGYSIDFVGSQQDGPSDPDFDRDHEGHSGWETNEIANNVYNWLVANQAEIILLHIGTNDISSGQSPTDISVELEQLLDIIDQYEFDNGIEITLFLARIVNRSDPNSQAGVTTSVYNNTIQTMADARIASGDKIIIVDQESALTYPDDMANSVHPNDAGYSKMASAWFVALDDYLSVQPENLAPTVDAGEDREIVLPADTVDLDGTVSDDGLPGGVLTSGWSAVDGPSPVVFGDAGAVDTTATFSAVGTYTLRLTADDTEFVVSDDMIVTVREASGSRDLCLPCLMLLLDD